MCGLLGKQRWRAERKGDGEIEKRVGTEGEERDGGEKGEEEGERESESESESSK